MGTVEKIEERKSGTIEKGRSFGWAKKRPEITVSCQSVEEVTMGEVTFQPSTLGRSPKKGLLDRRDEGTRLIVQIFVAMKVSGPAE